MYKLALKEDIFTVISGIIEKEKLTAFVIGGFVRDLILKRPNKDIDIVVLGDGIDLALKVAEKTGNKSKVTVFKNFGTAMFRYEDMDIEFVGARKESYNKNSRKPNVEPGSIEDDQKRRDFTINTLALGLNKKNFGQLIDPFNGIKDIEDKIIRTPLDAGITFSDDPLRMMRAIRFACQLGFNIEKDTFEAITKNKERIKIVSKERISDELNKIILSSQPSVGFKYLDNSGLLQIIFPELEKLKGVDIKNNQHHKDNFYHTLKVLDNISKKTDNLWLRWAAILHDIGKPYTKKFDEQNGWTFHGHELLSTKIIPSIFRNMRLPLNEKMKYCQKIVSLHHRPIVLSLDEVTDSAVRRLVFEAGSEIDDLLILCEADITSQNNELKKRYLDNFNKVRQKIKDIEEKDAIRNFQPPISGKEIMEYFELKPCREVGIIKNAIKEAILEGIIHNDRDEAFEYMKKKGKELGLKSKT
jgi:poly(A) polymerase